MSKIGKLATTGALALSLATAGLGASPALADGHGGAGIGLGLGLVTGLIIGDALANHHRHYVPDYGYDNSGYQPSCHPGHLQRRWQEICNPDGYCQNVKTYFRPEVCN